MELELFKRSREPVAVPLQVDMTNLTAELNATKEELKEWKAKATELKKKISFSEDIDKARAEEAKSSQKALEAAEAAAKYQKKSLQKIEEVKKINWEISLRNRCVRTWCS